MKVKTKTQIDSTNWAESTVYADGLGRTIKSEKKDNAGNVFTETEYDNMGRAKKVTNPYRTGDTKLWTENTFDDLSRVTKVKTPDTAEVNTAYSLSTSGTLGTVVTVTDQASKVRRSLTNGLGQLIRVDEPDDSGSLGTIASPNQATSYAYDTLNNLVTVTQGGQSRTFSYDAASRLKQAVNPESGTIGYTYDDNSNLTTKTDARSIVTTYAYDNFNRVKTRSYSDSTPTATYYYDGKGLSSVPSYSKGKLTKVSSSVSETKYTSFDNVGKVLTSQQVTDSNTYDFGYSYNLGGMLLEETYPSGRKVRNTIDTDASLSKVETMPSGGSYATRAESFSYTAAGAVASMKLGNAKWENAIFNNRLQPTQLGLGTSSTDQSLWKVNYDYGSTDDNGNVKSQTITVPSITPIVQTYTYDSLNRIKTAEETVSSSSVWKQTFTYDRFGNRRFDTSGSNTTTIPSGCSTAQCNPTIDTANNRFTTGQGYTYDLAGNLLTDAEGRTFVYDAENKQKTVSNSGGTIGTYSYDGDGKRVKKVSTTETTLLVYDASGKLISEYLLTELTPLTPTIRYLTSDALGSPRVITEASGNVLSRRDFMPFGEEILGLGGRISSLGYQTDSIKQKFTGYERDNETDLDFTQARYYSSKLGRFYSVDPENVGADEYSPQSWNGFSYVGNNPINLTDPTGLTWVTQDGKNYTWVDDAFYNSEDGQREYSAENGWRVGNGDIAYIGTLNGTYANGQYDNLIGNYAYHNADGTLSLAGTPGENGLIMLPMVAGAAIEFPSLVGGGVATETAVGTGIISNPVTATATLGVGSVAAWWWLYFPTAPPSQPMRNNSSISMANTAIPAFITTRNCACSATILMAKGGKQNIKNEWNKAAVDAVGGDVVKQLEWLAEAAKGATKAVKQKIKTAEKALGGRRSSGGDGAN